MHSQEREAITKVQQGDIASLATLVSLYQVQALRTAYMLLKDRQGAEDLVADGFITVYDRIEQFDANRPFAPWFYRIVVNAALMARRKTAQEHFAATSAIVPPTLGMASPEREALLQETRSTVLQAVNDLPSKQRAAIILRYYLDMEERMVAETLGCPLGTVKWRLHAARKRLRGPIARELGLRLFDQTGEASCDTRTSNTTTL
ncbi:MAG: RNA polymerase sigma factor [Chloroflexota bacterium]